MRPAKTLTLLCFLLAVQTLYGQAPRSSALEFNESGKAKLARGDRAGALADFNTAIEIDPGYAMAYNNRGVVLNESGDYDGAATRQGPELP